jgi:methionine synthase I (cobalamin-dependent)
LIVVETMYDLAKLPRRSRRALGRDIPLVCSFSYDRGTKTMKGVTPTKAARRSKRMGVDLVGINSGRSLDEKSGGA